LVSSYDREDGSISWRITNLGSSAEVSVLNAYTGNSVAHYLHNGDTSDGELDLAGFHGWYDLIVAVTGDSTFKYQLAGHVETGSDSFSDPAMGGLVTLKG
jgi:phospholipase C